MKKAHQKTMLFIIAALGIVSIVTVFLPALKDGDSVLSGLEVAFGKTLIDAGPWGSGKVKMNILAMIGYALPIIGALYALKMTKIDLIVFIVFLVSLVMLILVPGTTKLEAVFLGNTVVKNIDAKMGFGLIIAIIANALNTLVSLFVVVKGIK